MDAGTIQVFSGIAIVVNYAVITEACQFVAEGIHHVLAVMGLRVKGRVVALRLIVGGTSGINDESFSFFVLYYWCDHRSPFISALQHPYNTPSDKSSYMNPTEPLCVYTDFF
ncbi:MAG: hypothetical protein Q7K71_03875 [Candidatus Omnitrophota bacterium]|nr:hypothetical protein [Candidatus Omnitrophota bacterium]